MRKILLFTSLLLFPLFVFVATTSVSAAVRCEKQYGGAEVCVRIGKLEVNKKVWDRDKNEWSDNLGMSRIFAPGEEVKFQLQIKNVGDSTFGTVDVKDTLPGFLELVSGNTSFQIKDLTAGETEKAEITTRVVADKISSDKIICDVNVLEAVSGDERDRDVAQVCVEKKVVGKPAPKELPKAGAENWIIAGGFLFTSAIGAYLVRRKNAIVTGGDK